MFLVTECVRDGHTFFEKIKAKWLVLEFSYFSMGYRHINRTKSRLYKICEEKT